MENNKQINAILFDCDGLQHSERRISPYSENILKGLYPKYKLAMFSIINFDKFYNNEIRILQRNGTRNYFEVIKTNKNQPIERYMQCLNKLGVKAEEALLVVENFDEIKIADKFGFQTYFIQNESSADEFQNEENEQSINKIKSVDELLRIL